jgi:long-chain fatty acid transport protein
MMQLSGRHFSAALHRISTAAEFTDHGSNTAGSGDTQAEVEAYVPNFYYSAEISPELRAGFGFNSPFGLGLDYDADWLGRYHSIRSELRTFNLSPAIAYQIRPKLALGASLDVQYMDADMLQAVDFGTLCVAQQMGGGATQADALASCNAIGLQPQQDDGTQELKGDSWSVGYSLGVTYDVSSATRLGAVYHSGVRHDLQGSSDFQAVPAAFAATFADSGGSVTMDLPASVSLSVAHAASERLQLLADYTWTGWSCRDELRVEFDNSLPDAVTAEKWKDSSRLALGAHYRLSPSWLLRAGFAYDQTPVPDAEHRTPKVPDADRRWYTFGANWTPQPGFSIDLAYARVSAADIPIDNTDALGHELMGSYDVAGNLFSVQANWAF